MIFAYVSSPSGIRATTLLSFHDDTSGEINDFGGSVADSTVTHETRGEFASFFSRPVELYSYSWSENTALTTRYLCPWTDYFTSPRIVAKLAGFTRLRAKLHVKVVVNGSPFRYGLAMLSYRPLCNLRSSNTNLKIRAPAFSGGQIGAEILAPMAGAAYPGQATSDGSTVMARSQRPHILIRPHLGEAGEMVLPFVHYQDALSFNGLMVDAVGAVQNNEAISELNEMGSLVLENVVQLRSTASPDATPVTISIFVWASDVEVFGPSIATVQASEFDEAAAPKPSAVASTVAAAAGVLAKVPIIGPFALATQIAANAASGILKIFGWSNPPIITGMHGILNRYVWANPSPLVSIQDDVLAIDPKNEITVDPRVVGLGPADELCVSDLCSRSSIIDTVLWSPGDTQSTTLLSLPVAPAHFRAQWISMTASPSIPCARVSMPPYTYFASLFDLWRGDMVVEFEVVCSAFHRGRLAILWDPVSAGPPASAFKGDTITDVLDLANGNKMVYKVPFMAARGMLRTSKRPLLCYSSAQSNWTTWGNYDTTSDLGTLTSSNADYLGNGTVYLQVLNQLQSGDISSPVSIVVKVHFENMVLAIPATEGSIFEPVSNNFATGTIAGSMCTIPVPQAMAVPEGMQMAGRASSTAELLSRIYTGEAIPSLRPLLHRSQYYKTVTITDNSRLLGTSKAIVAIPMPTFPIARGGTCTDALTDEVIVPTSHSGTGATMGMNTANTTPIAYIAGCFTGWRGSMVWRASTDCDARTEIFLRRGNLQSTPYIYAVTIGSTSVDGNYPRARQGMLSNAMGGLASGVKEFGGVVGAVFPYYSPFRMQSPNSATNGKIFANASSTGQELPVDPFTTLIQNIPQTGDPGRALDVHYSVAAGTDFSVYGFVNVPDIYTTKL